MTSELCILDEMFGLNLNLTQTWARKTKMQMQDVNFYRKQPLRIYSIVQKYWPPPPISLYFAGELENKL